MLEHLKVHSCTNFFSVQTATNIGCAEFYENELEPDLIRQKNNFLGVSDQTLPNVQLIKELT